MDRPKRSQIMRILPDVDSTRYGSDQMWIRPDLDPTRFGSDQIWIWQNCSEKFLAQNCEIAPPPPWLCCLLEKYCYLN